MSGQSGIDAHGGSNGAGDVSNAAGTLKQDGYQFAAVYIDQNDTNETPGSAGYASSADGPPGASLTLAEAQTISAAGLNIVSIFETNGLAGSPYEGGGNTNANIVSYLTTQGMADGAEALASAEAIGQPAGSAIYFAIDTDFGNFSGAQDAVEDYLKGVSAGLGSTYAIGVYGSGQVLQWATTADPSNSYVPDVTYTWLSGSTGWTGYNDTGTLTGASATHGWSMIQSLPPPGTVAAGTDVEIDYDASASNAFGEWPACYCRGTLIRTERGDVPVEELAIGDRVVTHAGALEPIRWIGRRSYAGRFLAGKSHLLPICFKPGALAEGVPRRELRVSPKHAMFLDGVLVPAEQLVNGVSVVRDEAAQSVHYFHVELAAHDLIWAEGAASESFVDDASRGMFHNAHEYRTRYPEAVPVPPVYCAARLENGFELEAIRVRIDARAGVISPAPECGALRGFIDNGRGARLWGWAQDPARPEAPVCLDILVNGVLVAQTLANRYRPDLEAAGLGSGRHSFDLHLAVAVREDDALEVRRSADASPLAMAEIGPTAPAAAGKPRRSLRPRTAAPPRRRRPAAAAGGAR
ncbi:MAG: Hint domain-containing protein [Acidisphaera sp.]|nr:Hint domain-containing protein [Acidisphaera sp.]